MSEISKHESEFSEENLVQTIKMFFREDADVYPTSDADEEYFISSSINNGERRLSMRVSGDASVNVDNAKSERFPDIEIYCSDFIFEIGGNAIRFEDMCLSEQYLVMQVSHSQAFDFAMRKENDGTNPEYDFTNKIVILERLATIDDFIGMLHELGHANDFERRKLTPETRNEELALTGGTSLEERNAWAEALKIAKKFKLPFIDLIRECPKKFRVISKRYAIRKFNKIKKEKKGGHTRNRLSSNISISPHFSQSSFN